MIENYFENPFVKLHFYKFGTGAQHMLCFHGFGMHGQQFKLATDQLGHQYTFWGFDLFFHKETQLKDQSLSTIKKGLQKKELAAMISDFCKHQGIESFSVIGYSMGSHYATAIVEELPSMVNEYIVAAPSSVNPGAMVRFFGKNKAGNKILEKLMLSEKAMINVIGFCKFLRLIDAKGHEILQKEIATPELRFALYACFTYLRHLETDEEKLIKFLTAYKIKSIFIFGRYDKMYLPAIGKAFFAKYKPGKVLVLDENHEMINQNFINQLVASLS
ncbi:MAG: alpha/beta hydrolase [Candidatus Pedobacter colombiensis]|uniref:Alpha/beta hydrolase n=1 Tax=Candidatus Pedobacter colombiensis TaxID=3121371 RepID=A0AAJ6B8C5_9SPHI|nr:alpha/beta hydrolase [Pedobacter sp.]WEK20734.1 MAG: alpha/beta hydrolase [Pedobacter sp.]